MDIYCAIQKSLARLANQFPKSKIEKFIFYPCDYKEAKDVLLSTSEASVEWNNNGYECCLERGIDGQMFYDLLLPDTGTTIMIGELVEVYGVKDGYVVIRVPNDDNAYSVISSDFFERNFSRSMELGLRSEKDGRNVVADIIADAVFRNRDGTFRSGGPKEAPVIE